MNQKKCYCINLDPAIPLRGPNFPARVDIRNSINYKEVMRKYQLGPNGAILTCLNLFSTMLPDLIQLIEKQE